MSILPTIAQITNIVLTLIGQNADVNKFTVWRIDTNKPTEVLQNMQVQDFSFEDNKKLFEHPLETGEVIVDHTILEPNSCTIQAYIDIEDSTTLKDLAFLYQNSIPLQVRAENHLIKRAIISSKPFKVDSQHFDKTVYNISFKEALEVMPVYVGMPKAQNKSNSSRVNSGVKQAKEVKKNQSWLKNLFSRK